MVSLKVVQESNATIRTTIGPGQVSLFVGATSGIALTTMLEYAKKSASPRIYIVGRGEAKLSGVVQDLEDLNPQGTYIPIRSEISLLKNVDAACNEFQKKEKSLDLLVMCPGYLKLTRRGRSVYKISMPRTSYLKPFLTVLASLVSIILRLTAYAH